MENFLVELFWTHGIFIVVACFVVGEMLKPIRRLKNQYLPLLCGLTGALLGGFLPGVFPGDSFFTSAIQGLCLGWAATGGVETVRHLKKEDSIWYKR